jgi:hypothetical protein
VFTLKFEFDWIRIFGVKWWVGFSTIDAAMALNGKHPVTGLDCSLSSGSIGLYEPNY